MSCINHKWDFTYAPVQMESLNFSLKPKLRCHVVLRQCDEGIIGTSHTGFTHHEVAAVQINRLKHITSWHISEVQLKQHDQSLERVKYKSDTNKAL